MIAGQAGRRPEGRGAATMRVPSLSARHWHAPDYWLLVALAALVVFGTIIIFSATFAINLPDGGGTFAGCDNATEVACHATFDYEPDSKYIDDASWARLCAVSAQAYVRTISGAHWL